MIGPDTKFLRIPSLKKAKLSIINHKTSIYFIIKNYRREFLEDDNNPKKIKLIKPYQIIILNTLWVSTHCQSYSLRLLVRYNVPDNGK